MKIRFVLILGLLFHVDAVQSMCLPAGWDSYDVLCCKGSPEELKGEDRNYKYRIATAAVIITAGLCPSTPNNSDVKQGHTISLPRSGSEASDAKTRHLNLHSWRIEYARRQSALVLNNGVGLAVQSGKNSKIFGHHKSELNKRALFFPKSEPGLNFQKHRLQQPNHQLRPPRAPVIKHSGQKGRSNPYANLLTKGLRK